MTEGAERFYVVVTQPGAAVRAVFEAMGVATAGREPTNTVLLAHPMVSRHHARIEAADGGFVVEDLGSRNGTIVNGSTIAGRTAVPDPATISIGPFVMGVSREGSDETWTAVGSGKSFAPRTMLDRATRQLHIDGALVLDTLSANEYALLDLLALRAPAVVERATVGDTVWGEGQWDVYMLHNLVSRIRKRIAQRGAWDEVIVTVPGIGYRLE